MLLLLLALFAVTTRAQTEIVDANGTNRQCIDVAEELGFAGLGLGEVCIATSLATDCESAVRAVVTYADDITLFDQVLNNEDYARNEFRLTDTCRVVLTFDQFDLYPHRADLCPVIEVDCTILGIVIKRKVKVDCVAIGVDCAAKKTCVECATDAQCGWCGSVRECLPVGADRAPFCRDCGSEWAFGVAQCATDVAAANGAAAGFTNVLPIGGDRDGGEGGGGGGSDDGIPTAAVIIIVVVAVVLIAAIGVLAFRCGRRRSSNAQFGSEGYAPTNGGISLDDDEDQYLTSTTGPDASKI
jgi:hypothetical protein